jgi:hypothetical protein
MNAAPRLQHLPSRSMVIAIALVLIGGVASIAQEPSVPSQASLASSKLAVFVGTWMDEAEMKSSPFGLGGKMSLTETCDWFAEGFSVVCHTDTTGFMGDLETLTVLTYDSEEKVYRLYEFNSVGWNKTTKGTVDGDTWAFYGESKIGGKLVKTRSTIKIPSPDTAVMRSEVSVDGSPMTILMELRGTRVSQGPRSSNSCVPHASEGWPFELFECYRTWLSSH